MGGLSGRLGSRGDRGFAFVEFFTAIAVIVGAVAGISSAYPGVRRGANDKVAQSVSRHAATAAMVYRAGNRTFDAVDAAALDAIEPPLPDAAGEAPYDSPDGAYEITVLGGGTDFRIDVRHSRGGATRRPTAAGSAAPLP